MTKKLAFSGLLLSLFTGTAFAQGSEFYVVQSAADKTCQVSQTKPDGTTAMQVGTVAYTTQADAEAAMKAAAECKAAQ
jgi:hypothetical protein